MRYILGICALALIILGAFEAQAKRVRPRFVDKMVDRGGYFVDTNTVCIDVPDPDPSNTPPPSSGYCINEFIEFSDNTYKYRVRDCNNVNGGCPELTIVCDDMQDVQDCGCPCQGSETLPQDCFFQASPSPSPAF